MATIVVTDANVLINVIVGGLPDVFGRLPAHDFVVTDEVIAEITRPDQIEVLTEIVQSGGLRREALTDVRSLQLHAELRTFMGRGEAASLALAVARGWWIASDERRALLREPRRRLGNARIMNTPGLLVLAIRSGILTV